MFESGQVVGDRYRLEGRLGDNDSRQTWLAEDITAGELVVIKLLVLNGLTQWNDVKFLEREAKTLQSLHHDQLPTFREYLELADQAGWFALVMDYIPGVSLKQKLKDGHQFDLEKVEAIARSVLKILDYLHHHQPPILHRDLKPSNLIEGEDDQIYLIDFGAVQNQPRQAGTTFTVAGTFGYTPIEQFGGQTSPASDLYALGATLVHLLTGIAPMDLPQQNFRLQFRDRLPESLSQGWVNWLEQLTAPNVCDRYQSVTAALNELLVLQRDRRRGTSTPRSPEPPPPSLSSTDPGTPPFPNPGGTIAIKAEGTNRMAVELPSRFKVQMVEQGRSWLRITVIKGLLAQLQQQWQGFRKGHGCQIVLMVATIKVLADPNAALHWVLMLMGSVVHILMGILPVLAVAALFLSLMYGKSYFSSAALYLGEARFNLDIWGFYCVQGALYQIQSCDVICLNPTGNGRYGLAIAIRSVRAQRWGIYSDTYWVGQIKPDLARQTQTYVVGQGLPLKDLEEAAGVIQHWLKAHNPSFSSGANFPY